MVCREIQELEIALEELSRFCQVFSEECLALLKGLLGSLGNISMGAASGESNPVLIRSAKLTYRNLRNLWLEQVLKSGKKADRGLQEVFLDLLLEDDHLFFRQAEIHHCAALHPHLVEAMQGDLRILQKLAQADWSIWMERLCGLACEEEPGGNRVNCGQNGGRPTWELSVERENLKRSFFRSGDWGERVGDLAGFVYAHGHGIFRGCPVFRLRPPGQQAILEPIGGFVPFPLDWIEANGDKIEVVERNTLKFLQGSKANNVLIWGTRGCGKTTLIRGLIAKYYREGLRGIEISPPTYARLPDLFNLVRGRRESFVGVLDNISLAGRDESLHLLSSVLEGGLEQVPQNLVFYATSNFKDLVDREGAPNKERGRMQMDEGADDEPNLVNQGRQPVVYDPQQAERQDEQRALDDRFALKVFIDMPRKTEYEHMVLSYARRAGINMDQEKLLASFRVWCMRHNHDLVGGRTARDFIVDYLPPFVPSDQSEQIRE